MAKPVYINDFALATADDNGIALSQQPLAAGNLTLAGALVTGGVAIMDVPRRVSIESDGNDSGVTFTITGNQRVDGTGNTISETVTGPNIGAVQSVNDYGQVSSISISAAATGNIIAGTNGVGSTAPVMVNIDAQPVGLTISVTVTGTINYTVQYTLDNIMGLFDPQSGALQPVSPTWINDSVLASKTTSGVTTFNDPIFAWRVLINSGDGSLDIKAIQAGIVG